MATVEQRRTAQGRPSSAALDEAGTFDTPRLNLSRRQSATTTAPTRPAARLTPGTALALVGGGTAAVLVVGAVLVSMLLAVALTATSVAVCAVVIRSVLTHR
ncbi:SpdD-like protein [Streptomyces cinereospinus]|uniref:SpdD-like protein n=1 Tax=Streptomyces cinereospinus TaxID=285561 RepID=A0ABV5NB92_9ACTN